MIDNHFQTKGFIVWFICAVFFLYEFFLRTVIGSYQHPVMYDLDLTSFQFSLLSTTIFLLIYGLMQMPIGVIVDTIGLKKAMLIGCISCALSSLGFAYAYTFPVAIFFRLFMGFGAAFGFICLLISVHDWMPRKYTAIFIGLSQFIGTLGPIIAAGPLETMSESGAVNWRSVFIFLGFFGLALTVFIFLLVENNQVKAGKNIILKRPEKFFKSAAKLFLRLQPWYIAMLSASLYFVVEYLSENEGRAFLMLKGITLKQASYMLTISWIGYAIGCPLLGFFSDMFKRRKSVMFVAALIGLFAILTIVYSTHFFALQAAFFFLGMSASGQSIGYAFIAEHFKKEFVALGFALNNTVIILVAALNAPFIGFLLDRLKGEQGPIHQDYVWVFSILVILAVIAVILSAFFVRETYCKSVVDFTVLKPKKKD